jgi:hypothetical protein
MCSSYLTSQLSCLSCSAKRILSETAGQDLEISFQQLNSEIGITLHVTALHTISLNANRLLLKFCVVTIVLFPNTTVFEVPTAVVMKSTIFWDETPCSPLSVNRRFGGTGLLPGWFLAQLIFRPWRWRRYVPPKRWLTLNGLNGVIFQKMVLFKTLFVLGLRFPQWWLKNILPFEMWYRVVW